MRNVLTDLHLHSNFSDGKLTVPEIVDLFGKRGFGAIAITDHLCESVTFLGRAASYLGHTLTPENFEVYQSVLREEGARAMRDYGMLVIPGFELTKNTILNHRSAHVLALGVTEWIDASLPIEEICDSIHAKGGLAIAAHPVSTRVLEKQTYALWNRREELAPYFDAWEVASGKKIFEEVYASGLPMIANSDMHRPEQIESWKTVIEAGDSPLSFEAIAHAIRTQDLGFEYFNKGDAYDHGTRSRIALGRRNSSVDLRIRARLA
jgi:PHP family Zn ribbon phosphoesterase